MNQKSQYNVFLLKFKYIVYTVGNCQNCIPTKKPALLI